MALQIDAYEYPKHFSYTQIIKSGADGDPESLLAKYLNTATINGTTNFEKFITFFGPDEDQKALKRLYEKELRNAKAHSVKDIYFVYRYDVGDYCFIALETSDDVGGIWILKRSGIKWLMTLRDAFSIPAGCMIALDTENRAKNYEGGKLAKRYEYSIQLPDPNGSTDSVRHLRYLLFNGNKYELQLGKKPEPTDSIAKYINQVWLKSKEGTADDWLQLFPDEEAKEWKSRLKLSLKLQREYFNMANCRLIFAIDFGPQAAAFLEDVDQPQKPLKVLLLWNGKTKDYKLTDGSTPISDDLAELPFSPNLPEVFKSRWFQTALRKLVEHSSEDHKIKSQ